MSDIYFAATRYQYDTYLDLRRLFELSGFPTCYVDQIDISKPDIYITSPLNGEIRPHIANQAGKRRNAHIIHWDIERPSGSGSVAKYAADGWKALYDRTFDDVWVSDRKLAEETGFRFVVLGSDEGLGAPGNVSEKVYDIVHMSYDGPGRRQSIYNAWTKDKIGPNCWPPQRDEVLKQSRFALNVHQDIHPYQEPLRWSLFAAHGLPILSETVYDAFPWGTDVMAFADYFSLVPIMRKILDEPYGPWLDMAMRARERMTTEFRFRDVVLEAVKRVTEDWR